MSGRLAGASRRRLVLRHSKSGREHLFPLDVSGNSFTVRLPVAALPSYGATLPLPSGDWSLRGCRWTGADLPEPRVQGMHEFTLRNDSAKRLTLRVRKNFSADEQGAAAQAELQRGFYQRQRTQPVRDMIVFDSLRSASATRATRARSSRSCGAASRTWSSSGPPLMASSRRQRVPGLSSRTPASTTRRWPARAWSWRTAGCCPGTASATAKPTSRRGTAPR